MTLRVLCVRASAMGDVVHAMPAIRALAEARPDLELHALTQRSFAPLFAELPHIAGVVAHDRRPAWRGMVRTIRQLKRLRVDVALDFQGNSKSALLARLSRAPLRFGMAAFARREPASARLLNRRVTTAPDGLHPASLAFAIAEAAARELPAPSSGVAVTDPATQAVALDRGWLRRPALRATELERAREGDALRKIGIDPTRRFLVVVVGRPEDPRTWPVPHMAASLTAVDCPVVALLGPAEAQVVGPPGVGEIRHGAGELRRLVALGELVRMARGTVVGPDQGAVHVLAGTGASTRVVFGPQDPDLTAPASAEVLVTDAPPDCMPCRARRCTHPEGPVCMGFSPGL